MEENQEITEQQGEQIQELPEPQETKEEIRQEPEPQQEQLSPVEEERGLFEEHIRGLEAQGEALRQTVPGFDLSRELQNPVFLRLTAPGTGIGVEDAYYALHRREIQQLEARSTAEKVVKSIQSGSRRPLEAGTTSQGPSLTTFRYGSATREQREAFKKELRRAWGRGETVYPG